MAATINVAGKQVPKPVVIGGAVAAAGFVGWRWFQAGRSPVQPTGAVDPTEGTGTPPVPEPTDDTSFDIIGLGPPPSTNAEWTNIAQSRAVAAGFDGTGMLIALGKYLGRQPLTKTEADLVRTAIALAGPPPQNTPPYTIIEQPSGSGGVVPISTKPPAPSSVRASVSGHKITGSWSAVPGATGYIVSLIRGYPQGKNVGSHRLGLSTHYTFTQMPRNTTAYTVEVKAVNKSGTGPHKRSNPVHVRGTHG